jgi:signal transduction histidine kinase
MPATGQNPAHEAENIAVPFERVVALVRLLSHDLRNGLNTLDLQAAFVQELTAAGEAAPEVKRLRGMTAGTTKMLQALSAKFWLTEPHLVTYAAKIFVEDFRARLGSALPEKAPPIAWTETLGGEAITVDLEMIFRAFVEVFKNAVHFREPEGAIAAHAFAKDGRFTLEIRETKSTLPAPPETWGREPLVSTRRGGYGMGLFQTRRILTLHGGKIRFSHDAGARQLTTHLSLPLATGQK